MIIIFRSINQHIHGRLLIESGQQVPPGVMHFVLLNTAADKILSSEKCIQTDRTVKTERYNDEGRVLLYCVCLSSRDKTEPNPDLSLHGF